MTNYFDTASAVFQTGAGFMLLLNVLNLYKAKKVRGVSVWCQLFFVVWGLFAVTYFMHLNQVYSTYSAVFILLVNTIWLIQIFYYDFREKNLKSRQSRQS